MQNLSKGQMTLSWLMQLMVAGILLQTLFFKFTGADESVYIFSTDATSSITPEPMRPQGSTPGTWTKRPTVLKM